MTRIAVVIVATGIAFVALIILAGRTDWYDVSYRMSSGAIDAFDAFTDDEPSTDSTSGAVATLSDPATWNADFMQDARPTERCPTDTVANVRMRLAAIGPYTVVEYERTVASYSSTGAEPDQVIPIYNRVLYPVRRSIAATDQIYAYRFNIQRTETAPRYFSGYFVVRDDCLVHVEVIDNDELDRSSQ